MNNEIIDFLRNASDENVVAAKQNIQTVLSQKVADALSKRTEEVRDSIYNKKEE